MTRSRKRKLQRNSAAWVGMPLASTAITVAGMAQAQQPVGALEEIVVTAQKRTEDLQKVPISLQVLGSTKLDELQVADFNDFAKFLPSVSFQSLGPGQAQLYFRGIASGGDGLHAGSLPATGLYLDETPVTTIAGSLDIHVYDVARIEALAGPQGTLYGASSLSGTLRIITNKPDPDAFSAGFDVEANAFAKGDAGGAFEGYVNAPISDRAAVRLVGYYDKQGGFISNKAGSTTYQRANGPDTEQPLTVDNARLVRKNFNDVETYGARAALRIELDNQWTLTPSLLYQHQEADGAFSFDPKVGDLAVVEYRPDYNRDEWYLAALTIEGKIGNFDLLYSGSWFERSVDNQIDYTGYTIAYDYYGSGYTRFSETDGSLIDPTQYNRNRDKYTKHSQEIRLSSPQDERWRYTLGAFYQRQTDNIRAEYRMDGLPVFYEVAGQADVFYLSQQDRTDRDKAIFGEASWDFSDRWTLTGGIRQFWVDNTLYGFFGYNSNWPTPEAPSLSGQVSCFADSPVVTNRKRPCVNTDKRVTESGQTWKLNLTHQIDDRHMVYATYSTGFRPGGNNRRVEVVSYDSDTLSNYEIGWKTGWLDGRLRFNGSLFYQQWEGIQIGVQGVQGITSILNAGDAESKGAEFDLNWMLMDNLTLAVAGTYVDTETKRNFCPAPNGVVTSNCADDDAKAIAGTRLPVTPKFKANAVARYSFEIGNFASYLQGTLVHQANSSFSLELDKNAIVGDTPAFTTFDLSLGTALDNWRVEVYVENLFDERGELTRVSQCNADYCLANARVYPIKPLNFGVKFGMKF